jgi:AcrR family transcriptional regulator
MARPPDPARRLELLDQVVRYLADNGLAQATLRPMAAALGVSSNSLIHHFGPKEELLAAALDRATDLQKQVLARWLQRAPHMPQADQLRRWWKWLATDPANLALVRLGLEAAAVAPAITGLTGDVRADQIGVWRASLEAGLIRDGLSPAEAHLEASIVKATFTGLVMDLIATGDRKRLNAAVEQAMRRLEQVVADAASR